MWCCIVLLLFGRWLCVILGVDLIAVLVLVADLACCYVII